MQPATNQPQPTLTAPTLNATAVHASPNPVVAGSSVLQQPTAARPPVVLTAGPPPGGARPPAGMVVNSVSVQRMPEGAPRPQVQAGVMQAMPPRAMPPQGVLPPQQSVLGGLGGFLSGPLGAAPPQRPPAPAPQQPPRPPAAAPAGQPTLMCVTCPEDKKAGDALTVTAHGRRFALTVPPGVVGGQMFRVQLSIPPPEPHVQQPFWPKGPQQPKPQPKPQPQINLQPAEKLSVDLVAPHSLREAGMLTLDKRCFSLRCQARDATGAATMAPLSLIATLTYEDRTPLMPPEVRAASLTGNTAVQCRKGEAHFKLRSLAISSGHMNRRFRVRITPQDVLLAKERPGLTVETEAFTLVSNTSQGKKSVEKQYGARLPIGQEAGGQPQIGAIGGPRPTIAKHGALGGPTGAGAAALQSKIAQAAATLTRRRYFPAEAIHAATAPPACDVHPQQPPPQQPPLENGDANNNSTTTSAAPPPSLIDARHPPLSRHGVAACDRLAAMVVQQLTHRAWQHARKQRGATKCKLSASDVAAVAGKGMFDFLAVSGVVSEWAKEEPPQQQQPQQKPVAPPAVNPAALPQAAVPPSQTQVNGGPSSWQPPVQQMKPPPPTSAAINNFFSAPLGQESSA